MHKPEFVKRDCVIADAGYIQWLSDVKKRFRERQIRAINLCEEQGLPAPVFAEDFEFRSVIYRPEKQQADVLESADRDKVGDKVRDKAGDKARDKVTGQVIGQVPTQIQRIVFAIRGDNLTREEIMLRMGLSASRSFRENFL